MNKFIETVISVLEVVTIITIASIMIGYLTEEITEIDLREYEAPVTITMTAIETPSVEVIEVPEEAAYYAAPYDFISLKDEYQIYLEEMCADYEIDYWLMLSLMFSESSFREKAVGDGGKSVGLFQIRDCWWAEMDKKYGLDAHDPFDNIEIACIIFSKYMRKYDNESTAIQCYKCGESRGMKLLKEGKELSSIYGIMERARLWEEKKRGHAAE